MGNGVKRDITRIYNWQEDILLRIPTCDESTPFGPCDRDCLLSILIVVLGCKKRRQIHHCSADWSVSTGVIKTNATQCWLQLKQNSRPVSLCPCVSVSESDRTHLMSQLFMPPPKHTRLVETEQTEFGFLNKVI